MMLYLALFITCIMEGVNGVCVALYVQNRAMQSIFGIPCGETCLFVGTFLLHRVSNYFNLRFICKIRK